MKRRVQGLASSVKAVKKRSWREEEELPDSDDDDEAPKSKVVKKSAPKAPPKQPVDSDDELDMALDAALEEEQVTAEANFEGQPNPVVWMDLSVAGKPRGRVHFELYRDIVPVTAENFRRLCVGVDLRGRTVGYRDTELHKVIPGRLVEGGEFDCSATGKDFPDEDFKLTHAKGGLLSMCGAGPDANASRFQIVLRPSPELDNKQVVFGHVLPEGPTGVPSDTLHVLHWVEAVGTIRTGTTREPVVVTDCGECSAAEAASLVPEPRPIGSEVEPQESRYARVGPRPSKLVESVHRENLGDVLELTADALDSWEWEVKKAQRSNEVQERGREIEGCLKQLAQVLEEAKYKAGTVQGERGQSGRMAQSQQLRLKELQETLTKLY